MQSLTHAQMNARMHARKQVCTARTCSYGTNTRERHARTHRCHAQMYDQTRVTTCAHACTYSRTHAHMPHARARAHATCDSRSPLGSIPGCEFGRKRVTQLEARLLKVGVVVAVGRFRARVKGKVGRVHQEIVVNLGRRVGLRRKKLGRVVNKVPEAACVANMGSAL